MKEMQSKILVVDDDAGQAELLFNILSPDYSVKTALNGHDAIEQAGRTPRPDLILLDVRMPKPDGIDVCRILGADPATSHIPVILITGLSSYQDETTGLKAGAVDYIHKPYNRELILARVRNHLLMKDQKDKLAGSIRDKTKELKLTQALLIDSMGILAEYRDPETGGHIKRTQSYVNALAKALREDPSAGFDLTGEDIDLLHQSAPLHDIGKVGVPDRILNKPEQLTPEEFEIMKGHTTLGFRMLQKTMEKMPNKSFLRYAEEIAYCHHEKWDGSGYPRGLKGKEIPLSGRLMALADVYDALVNKRCYKKAFSHEEARKIIISQSGRHFDPLIVKAFLDLESVFRNIFSAYRDFDEDLTIESGGNGKKIRRLLIVDDNEINLEIMRNQLESLGFDVEMAENGKEAIEKCRSNRFDAVLTDLDMPEMNGYELSMAISRSNDSVPVIAVTASDYKINSENMKDFGFSGYLLKPFDDNMILSLIKSINYISEL